MVKRRDAYNYNRYLDVDAKPGPTLEVAVGPPTSSVRLLKLFAMVQLSQLFTMTAPISTRRALNS